MARDGGHVHFTAQFFFILFAVYNCSPNWSCLLSDVAGYRDPTVSCIHQDIRVNVTFLEPLCCVLERIIRLFLSNNFDFYFSDS